MTFAGGAARRVVGIPPPRGEVMMLKTIMDAQSAAIGLNQAPRTTREFDNFVEADSEQLNALTNLMHRVQDLSDRVLGAQPTLDGAVSKPQGVRAGHFGVLLDTQEAREAIGHRIADALSRLEKVL